jgi:hypothetical protein
MVKLSNVFFFVATLVNLSHTVECVLHRGTVPIILIRLKISRNILVNAWDATETIFAILFFPLPKEHTFSVVFVLVLGKYSRFSRMHGQPKAGQK